ncbi:BRCT domain-containing protein [Halorussus ruber]|uniref:BRCT domain-containing protein n=1 Tax=Halorussus ruber TaxID=1126238 RepID=UPI001091F25F|nr:BRCT domain-containing protein [Halorussus ruber]
MARGDDIGGAEVRSAADLEDQTVVFAGRLAEVTRSEVTELVEECGARVTTSISDESDLLVVGDEPGDEKLTFFANHDLPSLTEAEFYALFPERFGHVDGVPEASADGGPDVDSAMEASEGDSADEPTLAVEIELDPVVCQLATIEAKRTDRTLDAVVAESTQSLLKEVIDGESLEADAEEDADETESVEVALPENLRAMVETAVTTTEGVESVPAFVAEACRVDFGFDFAEKQELSLGLPKHAVTALKELSDDEERCVEDLARDLLCDGLEDALTAASE